MRKFIGAALLAIFAIVLHAADAEVRIASQGGSVVTLADIAAFLARMPADRWPGFLDSPKRVDQMVIGILRNKQLAKQARDLKIDEDPGVKAEIELAAEDILARKRVEAFEKTLTIPPFTLAAKEEYTTHKKDYARPAQVVVQHVLISSTNRSDAETKEIAEKVYKEALAKPDDFEKLVEKYSDDPSKPNNLGVIRDATSDKLVPDFVAGVKKLTKLQEISPPVRTQFGYHVIKLVENDPPTQFAFEAVQSQIEANLKQNYIAEQRKALFAKLDSGAPTVNPDMAQALHDRFVPAGVITPSEAANGKKN